MRDFWRNRQKWARLLLAPIRKRETRNQSWRVGQSYPPGPEAHTRPGGQHWGSILPSIAPR